MRLIVLVLLLWSATLHADAEDDARVYRGCEFHADIQQHFFEWRQAGYDREVMGRELRARDRSREQRYNDVMGLTRAWKQPIYRDSALRARAASLFYAMSYTTCLQDNLED